MTSAVTLTYNTVAVFRKTLTILSLIGLLLSGGVWLISYHGRPAVRTNDYFAALSSGTFTYVTEYMIDAYWGTKDSGNARWRYRSIRGWSWKPEVDRHWGFGFHLPLYLPSAIFAVMFIWSVYPSYRESLIQQRHLKVYRSSAIITFWLALAIMLTGIVVVKDYWKISVPMLAVAGVLIAGCEWVRERRERGLCLRCGYDLRASKERCPECGESFETPKLDADC